MWLSSPPLKHCSFSPQFAVASTCSRMQSFVLDWNSAVNPSAVEVHQSKQAFLHHCAIPGGLEGPSSHLGVLCVPCFPAAHASHQCWSSQAIKSLPFAIWSYVLQSQHICVLQLLHGSGLCSLKREQGLGRGTGTTPIVLLEKLLRLGALRDGKRPGAPLSGDSLS